MGIYQGSKLMSGGGGGPSPYEIARQNGYTGTENEFNRLLAALDQNATKKEVEEAIGQIPVIDAYTKEETYSREEIDNSLKDITASTKATYIPSYLAFISSHNDDSVAAALGKNNSDIQYVGMALAKYEEFKNPETIELSHLKNIKTIDELFNSVDGMFDLNNAPNAKALLEGNSYTSDRFSNMSEGLFCSTCAKVAGDPNYINVTNTMLLAESMKIYTSAYVGPFNTYSNGLELYKETLTSNFFKITSPEECFATQGMVDMLLDLNFLNKYINDNASSFRDAAAASSLVQTNTESGGNGSGGGWTGTIYICGTKCFALSAAANEQRCFNQSSMEIRTGLYNTTLAKVSGVNNTRVSYNGLAVCSNLHGYFNYTNGYNVSASGTFIAHS